MKDRNVLSVMVICLFSLILLSGFSVDTANAAGFAIVEQSVSGLGNAFAGGAAVAEDATTIFFNPAGITRIPDGELIVGAHIIIPSAKFKNEGSTHLLQSVTGIPLTGDNGGEGGVTVAVPNFYYSRQLGEGFVFGLGVNSPFGLSTDYDDSWVGRYHAIKSKLMTVNINPVIAYRVNEHFSMGAGLNFQYIKAELTSAIDFGTLDAIGAFAAMGLPAGALGLVPQGSDGYLELKGDSWGYGFNIGALYEFNRNSRIGINYRSRVDQDLEGDADFSSVPAGLAPFPVFKNVDVSSNIILPDTLSLSFYHRINPAWAVMGDVTWTDWSVLDEIRFSFDNPYQSDGVTTTAWKDSFRYSLGLSFTPDERWTFRAGLAYDETPIPDAQHRTPRIPDENRLWTSAGMGYKISSKFSFDLAYAHLFVSDPRIEKTPTGEDAVRGGLTGSFDAKVDIISAQINWRF